MLVGAGRTGGLLHRTSG